MKGNSIAFANVAAARRIARILFFAGLFAVGLSCSPAKPGPNHCPHSPQPGPVDAFDPWIRIISPNGGEVFHVGDQCTLKVRSRYPVSSAEVLVNIGGAVVAPTRPPYIPLVASLPGDSAAGAGGDTIVKAVIFSIPDSFAQQGGGIVSSISDECLIAINTYAPPYYGDTSNCYFSIISR